MTREQANNLKPGTKVIWTHPMSPEFPAQATVIEVNTAVTLDARTVRIDLKTIPDEPFWTTPDKLELDPEFM